MPKQPVSIELGGETRHLWYDFNAFELIQEGLGVSPLNMEELLGFSFDVVKKAKETEAEMKVVDLVSKVKFKNLIFLVWAGLLHESDGLKRKEVGRWLSLGNLVLVFEKVIEAYTESLRSDDEGKNESSPKTADKPKETIPGRNTKKIATD